jgi:hypothetical protein
MSPTFYRRGKAYIAPFLITGLFLESVAFWQILLARTSTYAGTRYFNILAPAIAGLYFLVVSFVDWRNKARN